jgi:hypothetical protein
MPSPPLTNRVDPLGDYAHIIVQDLSDSEGQQDLIALDKDLAERIGRLLTALATSSPRADESAELGGQAYADLEAI